MAGKEEGEGENTPRSDWEVVSLTASAYAAAPGPTEVQKRDDVRSNTYGEAEASHALFMSDHFVFPPNQHENLPLEPEDSEIHEYAAGKQDDTDLTFEGDKTMGKDDKDQTLKIVHDEFQGIQFFDEKSEGLPIQNSEYESDKGQSPYSATTLNSLHSETASVGFIAYDDHISREAIGSGDTFDPPVESSQLSKPLTEEDNCAPDLPCSAWWKKRAASLYAQAKDANAIWSIFIAASVMGLVMLGQHWQQERWQILQQKWHLSFGDQKMGKMLGPIYRIKDVIVGGHRRGSLIRGSSSSSSSSEN